MNGITDILDWLVDEKVIGLPVAIPIALAAVAAGWFGYSRWSKKNRIEQTIEARDRAQVQEATLQDVSAKGDVSVEQRQDSRRG